MSKRSEYIFLGLCGVLAVVMIRYRVNQLWILVAILLLGYLFTMQVPKLEAYLWRRKYGGELRDPFRAEVIHDGRLVAILTDRVFTEMFWRRYRIEPVDEFGDGVISDDSLWEVCRFTFRDPLTGSVCQTGFAGGPPPYIRDGRISLRGLLFPPTTNQKET